MTLANSYCRLLGKTYNFLKPTGLILALLISIVGCGGFEKSSNTNGSDNASGSVQETVNQLGDPGFFGENNRSYRSFDYSLRNGFVDESVFLRVLWSKDHKIKIKSVSINGVKVGEGSYFDNHKTYEVDSLSSQSEQSFLNLYNDYSKSEALWGFLKAAFDGAQYVIIKGFENSELEPFLKTSDKEIPIVITIEIDGKVYELNDKFAVPGKR